MISIYFGLLVISCRSQFPCYNSEGLHAVNLENPGSPWNCGISDIDLNSSQVDSVCKYLGQLKPLTHRPNIRSHHWYVSIHFNEEKRKLFADHLYLLHTKFVVLFLKRAIICIAMISWLAI